MLLVAEEKRKKETLLSKYCFPNVVLGSLPWILPHFSSMAMEKLGLKWLHCLCSLRLERVELTQSWPSTLLFPAVRGSPAGLECTVVRGKHVGHTSEAASTQTGDKCLCKTVLLSATMEQVWTRSSLSRLMSTKQLKDSSCLLARWLWHSLCLPWHWTVVTLPLLCFISFLASGSRLPPGSLTTSLRTFFLTP